MDKQKTDGLTMDKCECQLLGNKWHSHISG